MAMRHTPPFPATPLRIFVKSFSNSSHVISSPSCADASLATTSVCGDINYKVAILSSRSLSYLCSDTFMIELQNSSGLKNSSSIELLSLTLIFRKALYRVPMLYRVRKVLYRVPLFGILDSVQSLLPFP